LLETHWFYRYRSGHRNHGKNIGSIERAAEIIEQATI
jgi:hypothetical protein